MNKVAGCARVMAVTVIGGFMLAGCGGGGGGGGTASPTVSGGGGDGGGGSGSPPAQLMTFTSSTLTPTVGQPFEVKWSADADSRDVGLCIGQNELANSGRWTEIGGPPSSTTFQPPSFILPTGEALYGGFNIFMMYTHPGKHTLGMGCIFDTPSGKREQILKTIVVDVQPVPADTPITLTGVVSVGGAAPANGYFDTTFTPLPAPAGELLGNVSFATVSAYQVNTDPSADGSTGPMLATTQTDAQGHFTLTLPGPQTGPIVIKTQGGQYYSGAYPSGKPFYAGNYTAMVPNVPVPLTGLSIGPTSSLVYPEYRNLLYPTHEKVVKQDGVTVYQEAEINSAYNMGSMYFWHPGAAPLAQLKQDASAPAFSQQWYAAQLPHTMDAAAVALFTKTHNPDFTPANFATYYANDMSDSFCDGEGWIPDQSLYGPLSIGSTPAGDKSVCLDIAEGGIYDERADPSVQAPTHQSTDPPEAGTVQ